ncbi:unnamed protein product [Periconia digitata]|uniref:Uncharacterized protein n=1 Tax=Periconia digitata TaxID=1303443 RepID=A0A9W4UPA0_9PLEO|nr:unnamed protein product [Periconia digitata]
MAKLRNAAISVATTSVAGIAVFYQLYAKEFVFDTLGFGRTIEPIENFRWNCRRMTSAALEGCEDMWLDNQDRVLYAACSGSLSRGQWNPGLSKYNISGRRPGGSQLISIKIDEPTVDGFFPMRSVGKRGYKGVTGDQSLDLIGFDVDNSVPGELRFWLINQRPPVDTENNFLDASKVGANVTVDVFSLKKRSKYMNHLQTIVHSSVYSANNLALMGDGTFVLTNDHSGKVGMRKELDLFIGGGNVVHCQSTGDCKPVIGSSLKFANGIARDQDGLVYVAFTGSPYIGVYRFTKTGQLEGIDRIPTGMAADNLSVDSNGDIWAVGIPKVFDLVDSIVDPFNKESPSTIFKIHKSRDGKYKFTKVLEDRDARFVASATIAVFDSLRGRLFIGGAATPFVTVCEPIRLPQI